VPWWPSARAIERGDGGDVASLEGWRVAKSDWQDAREACRLGIWCRARTRGYRPSRPDPVTARGIPFTFSSGYVAKNVLPERYAEAVVMAKPFDMERPDALVRGLRERRGEASASSDSIDGHSL
jgi:hypothetical protein